MWYWSRRDPVLPNGLFYTVTALDASGQERRLQLSTTHYMPVSRDESGACAAMAAAASAGSVPSEQQMGAWATAAQVGCGLASTQTALGWLRQPAAALSAPKVIA